MATGRRDRGRFTLDADSLRLAVTNEPSPSVTAAAVRGDTVEFREDPGGGRRVGRAPEAGTMLPSDRRCAARAR